ncbi:hypothetical protein ACIQWV_07840 [Streptomyces sp. NPDC098085]|uniref:hypothetical protein n=1 Tax=Streptomyces sp. NPDC098085 TaxID=3366094 RepID=UPI003811CBB9
MPVTASTEPGLLRARGRLQWPAALHCSVLPAPGPAIDRAAYKATITMLTTDA